MKRKLAPQRRRATKSRSSRHRGPGRLAKIKTILVPIDFSSASFEPIQWAKFIAKKTGAKIHFLHVHDFAFPLSPPMTAPVIDSENEITHRLLRDLKKVASDYNVPGAKSTCHIRTGRPSNQICKLADEIGADLIAISTHGRTGWQRVLLGSTAELIVRHAPCPVLVVRRFDARKKETPRLKKILAPVDFSDCSAKGLAYAIGLARSFDAEMILLNTFQIHHDLPPVVVYSESKLVRWAREIAEGHMTDLVKGTDFAGVKFETVIKKGPGAQTIDRYAYKIHADLIVTSTHGWTGLSRVLLGSTAEQIVRYAKSPVLVVPTK